MLLITNITDEPHQRHTIIFGDSEIVLTIRFLPTVEMWFFDVEYKGKVTNGVKLAVGVLHVQSRNYPFDIMIADNAGIGQDPFRIDDFSAGRCSLYIIEADEMAEIRGVTV